ncbi:pathogenesis-related protein PRB1-3 [Arachis duranensis]|uniref:Pathogenesis-related protein PRB1-3 n=1 Tax=Arachis duranensis TaxID=130453 RepID=A0A6P5N0W8_ARADU|nr:pathogenesis-related protein PRB1-3 [Arachis duranensis]
MIAVFMDVYSSSNSTRLRQQRWDDASTGFGAATHVGDADSCRPRMFDRVRSDGGSSSEGISARRRSATVLVGRNGGYTSRRNRAVERRLLRTWQGGGEMVVFLRNNGVFLEEDYLEGHNVTRAKVGVKPLKWDKQLESLAHEFVNEHIANCRGLMSTPHYSSNSIYGRNSGYNPYHASAASAVKAWVAQGRNYDPKSNKCIDGNPASCHCYVQVVWGASTYLGCARGDCHNNEGTLVACYYHPGGNFPAQRPYSMN